MIEKTIALLGLRGTDKITGLTGVIDSVCFDLYGCVQVSLAAAAKPDGEVPSGRWFDVQRITVIDDRVMQTPDFQARASDPASYDHGPACKAPPR